MSRKKYSDGREYDRGGHPGALDAETTFDLSLREAETLTAGSRALLG